jgi:hypothetical protein
MLWRLQERATVVRWLLGHGRVMDAITLCIKRGGQWRAGLAPGSIAAVEFFTATIKYFENYRSGKVMNSLTLTVPNSQVGDSSAESDHFNTGNRTAGNQYQHQHANLGKLETIYTVNNFIREWDKSILSIQQSTVRDLWCYVILFSF